MEPVGSDWDAARAFYEARRVKRVDLGGAGDWKGWSDELDGVSALSASLSTTNPLHSHNQTRQTPPHISPISSASSDSRR